MAVENQKYFSLRIFSQAFKKRDAYLGVELAIKNHKSQSPAIGNCGDHLVRKSLPRNPNNWRLPNLAIGATNLDLAAKDYPPEVIAEWGSDQTPYAIEKHKESIRSKNELVWVAEISGKIQGFSALVPSADELRAVYVIGAAAKNGLGTALLKVLESKAIELGLRKLQMHSSVNAQKFYEKNGYKNLGKGSHLMRSGQKMACYIMEKILSV